MDILIDLKKIAESMSEQDLIFAYQGYVNDEMVNDILQMAEIKLKPESVKTSVKRKIFRVLFEGIQNSYKHQNNVLANDAEMRKISTVLARKGGFYELSIGNYILNDDIIRLKKNIDQINGQKKDELRENYRMTLNNNARTKSGGSGLGLMDIARKTGERLNYNFSGVNADVSYFTINIKVNKNE